MLTRDRPEMAARAVRSFRAQTYPAKRLLIYDTGQDNMCDLADSIEVLETDEDIEIVESQAADHHGNLKTIGYLRNRAIHQAEAHDIIIHWDDDDVSHPRRIEEQIALLKSSGAECVGYREVLFWRRLGGMKSWDAPEAWLYSVPNPSWACGASFCYWRSTWERRPFPDLPKRGVVGGSSEDVAWRREVKCIGVRGIGSAMVAEPHPPDEDMPRLVCGIHGGNTMQYELEKYPDSWRRVPEWDAACRRMMEL
jgi:hypothetical protein